MTRKMLMFGIVLKQWGEEERDGPMRGKERKTK
jgi:hypothetical protein